ncbi:hypothetical protein BHM03_00050460, partial [Ensete ventricosum]
VATTAAGTATPAGGWPLRAPYNRPPLWAPRYRQLALAGALQPATPASATLQAAVPAGDSIQLSPCRGHWL